MSDPAQIQAIFGFMHPDPDPRKNRLDPDPWTSAIWSKL